MVRRRGGGGGSASKRHGGSGLGLANTVSDSKSVRCATLMPKMPYYTTMTGVDAVAEAIDTFTAANDYLQPLTPPIICHFVKPSTCEQREAKAPRECWCASYPTCDRRRNFRNSRHGHTANQADAGDF